jgi:hypothetical protein
VRLVGYLKRKVNEDKAGARDKYRTQVINPDRQNKHMRRNLGRYCGMSFTGLEDIYSGHHITRQREWLWITTILSLHVLS